MIFGGRKFPAWYAVYYGWSSFREGADIKLNKWHAMLAMRCDAAEQRAKRANDRAKRGENFEKNNIFEEKIVFLRILARLINKKCNLNPI